MSGAAAAGGLVASTAAAVGAAVGAGVAAGAQAAMTDAPPTNALVFKKLRRETFFIFILLKKMVSFSAGQPNGEN